MTASCTVIDYGDGLAALIMNKGYDVPDYRPAKEHVMPSKTFAIVMGVIFLMVGLLGFFPGLVTAPSTDAPHISLDTGYGNLMGLFPINVLHNIVHLAVGLWGVVAYRSVSGSLSFARGLAVFYGALTIMGFIPGLNTTFGLIPIFGHDIWLHAISAGAAAYVGFAGRSNAVPIERTTRRAS